MSEDRALSIIVREVEEAARQLYIEKAARPSRRLSVAFTKLEEALLWLGAEQHLGCCGEEAGCKCK